MGGQGCRVSLEPELESEPPETWWKVWNREGEGALSSGLSIRRAWEVRHCCAKQDWTGVFVVHLEEKETGTPGAECTREGVGPKDCPPLSVEPLFPTSRERRRP